MTRRGPPLPQFEASAPQIGASMHRGCLIDGPTRASGAPIRGIGPPDRGIDAPPMPHRWPSAGLRCPDSGRRSPKPGHRCTGDASSMAQRGPPLPRFGASVPQTGASMHRQCLIDGPTRASGAPFRGIGPPDRGIDAPSVPRWPQRGRSDRRAARRRVLHPIRARRRVGACRAVGARSGAVQPGHAPATRVMTSWSAAASLRSPIAARARR